MNNIENDINGTVFTPVHMAVYVTMNATTYNAVSRGVNEGVCAIVSRPILNHIEIIINDITKIENE